MSDAGAAALATGLLLGQGSGGSALRHLDLSANRIGPRGAEVCYWCLPSPAFVQNISQN